MYKMDITILGYKLNLEILILIGVIYLILVGHMFCGCCRFEGFESSVPSSLEQKEKDKKGEKEKAIGEDEGVSSSLPVAKEGFTGANINYGESSEYQFGHDNLVNTSSWFAKDLVVVPGKSVPSGVKEFLDRGKTQKPISNSEMDFFANTEFKPEYCPNTFSQSGGCAAMTAEQYNFLKTRGNNNVPYSEY